MGSILTSIFGTASLFCGFTLATFKISLLSSGLELSIGTDFELEILVGFVVVDALELFEVGIADLIVLLKVKGL